MNASASAGYEELEHTADLRLRAWAMDLPGLFTEAALGLGALLQCRPPASPVAARRTVHLRAGDAESLLVTWLSELLYLNETQALFFSQFDLRLAHDEDGALTLAAAMRGVAGCPARRSIKAVTFHDLSISSRPSGAVEAVVTFDA